jgi:hypothetical protein
VAEIMATGKARPPFPQGFQILDPKVLEPKVLDPKVLDPKGLHPKVLYPAPTAAA